MRTPVYATAAGELTLALALPTLQGSGFAGCVASASRDPVYMLSMLTEPEPIRAILESTGLPSTPPVPARARYPSLFDDSQLESCEVA